MIYFHSFHIGGYQIMKTRLNIIANKADELPNNIEAEQSVIGSVLLSNEIFV